ncbi:N4-gp56 family major capsid protein [Hoeflea poritis]|uniref:N4-gp56 family major capsid protein n=1 Tax=Hoeflea poritis TaxID=2993659 RepID=A0ABT4VMK3_9HYPH|nr:N4-gp56 family major capsid protein [Hoeflea poritis]MDA4845944.1 N4-gp56 family major capsid protein [Hoeflea poritis]
MPTTIAAGDPKAAKKWSTLLFLDLVKRAYFERKFVGQGQNNVIQRLTDLETDAGDTIDYDLSVKLRNRPTTGDARLTGKEESLRFFSDEVKIDQSRHAVSAGGRMTRKRTVHNLRTISREKLSEYWSDYHDQLMFIYLSGSRGINEDFYEAVTYTGHAGNALAQPSTGHILYGETGGTPATAKANLTANHKMNKNLIERASTQADMMHSVDPENANMVPVDINGEGHYVVIMNPFQAHDLRTSDTTGWLDIQKAATQAEGRNNPIFKGGLGMINDVVLHKHKNGIRFNDYGAGANVLAGRALFCGRQAGVIAYGSADKRNKGRYSWKEESKDYENELTVSAGCIFGAKKATFNSRDFGVVALDTAAANPNA